jgi:hypothetical protein
MTPLQQDKLLALEQAIREDQVAKATESVSVDAGLTLLDRPVSFSGTRSTFLDKPVSLFGTRSTNLEGLAGLVSEAEPNAGHQSGLCGVPQQGQSGPCNSTPCVVFRPQTAPSPGLGSICGSMAGH